MTTYLKKSLDDCIKEYKAQLEIGTIQKAYQGLMEYIMALRNHFVNNYPDNFVVGQIYQGYMDKTYFPFTPKSLKDKNLRVVIAFDHEEMIFGIWLIGQNKQTQKQYWRLFKEQDYNKYNIPPSPQDFILGVLIDNPNFDKLDSLTKQIEFETIKFIKDISEVLE